MVGLIPSVFIDDLLTRVDVVDLIDSYLPLKKQGATMLLVALFIPKKPPVFLSVAVSSSITVLAVVPVAMQLVS